MSKGKKKKKIPKDQTNKLMDQVSKTNPQFVEWLRKKQNR
jgi:hypothetical protein